MKFKEGDYVRVVEREQTPADVKSGLYYPFFAGLSGTVDRIYDTEVCIKVDLDTLPKDVLKRHLSIQDSIKRKWLAGLSGEARNRLTGDDRKFDLSYTLLVQESDLEAATPSERPAILMSADTTPDDEAVVDAIKPVTSDDLEAAESEYLKEREQLKNQN